MDKEEKLILAEKIFKDNPGISIREISRRVDIRHTTISYYLKQNGHKIEALVGNCDYDKFEKYEQGEKLFLEKKTLRYISQELKIGRRSFTRWLRKRGHYIKASGNAWMGEEEENRRLELAEYYYTNEGLTRTQSAKKAEMDSSIFADYLLEQGYNPTNKKYELDTVIFEKIDTEEKAYWLAFLYADATITCDVKYTVDLALKAEDYEDVKKFQQFMKTNAPVTIREVELNGKTFLAARLQIHSKKIVQDLMKLGCTPNKTFTLTFPNKSIVPKDFVRDFIRGYFDGDGCLSKSGNDTEISIVGNKEFLDGIQKFCNLPNNKRSEQGNAEGLRLGGNIQVFNFTHYLYHNATIYLDRKYERYQTYFKDKLREVKKK